MDSHSLGVKMVYWSFLALSIVAVPHVVPLFIKFEDPLLQDFVEAFLSITIGVLVTWFVIRLLNSNPEAA